MVGRLIYLTGALVGAAVLAAVGFTLALRFQFPPVLNGIRRMNKAFLNPRALETAGQSGASASVVHHRGRSSGTDYRTPVSVYPVEGGFLIPLPYGRTADWTRNVMAAGDAEIFHEGVVYGVDRPEFVARDEAVTFLPPGERRLLTTMGVAEVLRFAARTPVDRDDQPVLVDRTPAQADA